VILHSWRHVLVPLVNEEHDRALAVHRASQHPHRARRSGVAGAFVSPFRSPPRSRVLERLQARDVPCAGTIDGVNSPSTPRRRTRVRPAGLRRERIRPLIRRSYEPLIPSRRAQPHHPLSGPGRSGFAILLSCPKNAGAVANSIRPGQHNSYQRTAHGGASSDPGRGQGGRLPPRSGWPEFIGPPPAHRHRRNASARNRLRPSTAFARAREQSQRCHGASAHSRARN
jgi:hypothetical protein